MVLPDHDAVTPVGRLLGVPIPVAPVVVKVTLGIASLKQTVGLELAADTVLVADTVIMPVALNVPQPPLSGML